MLNQQQKRPLSIGSAVQFTHKRETIHGHLLQRQGQAPLLEGNRHRGADLESPGVGVETLGRSAASHGGHAARQSAS